ncbi:cyclin-T1-3-like isoform X2 [Andrographis paniculata]|uniref:cyclin-T1-3-like isoform X2 n=1 Tax=Andrographis paniculata TaxID=175694 RepID=UPI0021E84253|nr:cyclin-T1-3-like isoform X2 [Andrographis paniculata]
MAIQMPGNPSHNVEDAATFKPKWYFTEEEIEKHSASRKDGIGGEQESRLRHLYCSYLQKLGMELKLPQVTIATAMMLCHRFYMYQSHSKNHWQTVANSSMFLGSKAEDTPCSLRDFVLVAYKLMHDRDPIASEKIRQKDVYEKQKQLILLGEQLILVTVAFDLNIEHPYKPLVAALKKLGISQKEVFKVAWNFVNDWLRTTLCLQYKPHYIAAGSVYLAAKLQKIKLPSSNGNSWWMQFDVSPKLLEEVIQRMLQLLGKTSKQTMPASCEDKGEPKAVGVKRKLSSSSAELHNPNGLIAGQALSKYSVETARISSECSSVVSKNPKNLKPDPKDAPTTENCPSESGSANSTVEDVDTDLITADSNQASCCKIVSANENSQKIDISKIREKLKRRKMTRKQQQGDGNLEDEMNDEAWIEKELEKGIELLPAASS